MSDLSIHPVYLSARAAIVAPEKAIPVTFYSVQKWLPRLGPERWCLVMLLRSLSIDTPRRGDGTKRVTCSWRELAELLDVHEETIASWLKHQPIANDKPWRKIIPADEKSKHLGLFVPRLRYAYETHNGKTRRTGFMLEVLMEDPVAPEDEERLKQQIEILQMQQAELGLETYRLDETIQGEKIDLPQISDISSNPNFSDSHYVNQMNSDLPKGANPNQLGLHNQSVNPEFVDLQTSVKQLYVESGGYVNPTIPNLHNDKSDFSGKNVNELDILIQQLKHSKLKKPRRNTLEPIISLTEALLNDDHSTAMFHKVLITLYPERLDLYVAAVRVAVQVAESDPGVNSGAVFVRALRDFADVAGVDLGLKNDSGKQKENGRKPEDDGLGTEVPVESSLSFSPPSVDEAIWAETQIVLQRQMTRATYDAVVQGTQLIGHKDGLYVVGVQTEMAKAWLENRLREVIQRALSSVIGTSVDIEFRLMKSR